MPAQIAALPNNLEEHWAHRKMSWPFPEHPSPFPVSSAVHPEATAECHAILHHPFPIICSCKTGCPIKVLSIYWMHKNKGWDYSAASERLLAYFPNAENICHFPSKIRPIPICHSSLYSLASSWPPHLHKFALAVSVTPTYSATRLALPKLAKRPKESVRFTGQGERPTVVGGTRPGLGQMRFCGHGQKGFCCAKSR